MTEETPLNCGDLASVITLLINELKQSHKAEVNLLQEKILKLEAENKRLVEENTKNKEERIYTTQQATLPQTSLPQIQQTPQAIPKQRGIRAHKLMFNMPKVVEENPQKIIEELLLEKFSKKPSINAVQKIEAKGLQNEESRFLVTFNSIWEARMIYRDRFIALQNSSIYISEDLTKEEASIFYLTRQMKKRNLIHATWTENGDIFIIEAPGTMPRIVQRNDDIFNKLPRESTEQEKYDTTTKLNTQQRETEEVTHEEHFEDAQDKEPTEDTQSTSKQDTKANKNTKAEMSKIIKRITRQTNQADKNDD
jgi:hypothetical protein